jgi:hypothetical protein
MNEKPQTARLGGGTGGPTGRTVDLADPKPEKHRMLPVWFFVGVILLIYGVLILASGVEEFAHPPSTVLASLHPAVWWGALLALIGAVYVYLFGRRRT